MKIKKVNMFFMQVSKTSFVIFLIHHVIILKALKIYMPENNFLLTVYLIAIIGIIIVLADIIFVVNKIVLNSKVYLKFEKKICNKS